MVRTPDAFPERSDLSQPTSELDLQRSPFVFRHEAIGLAIAIGLIILIFLASIGHVLVSGDPYALAGLGDAHALNGPKAYFLDVRLQQGEYPMWDPLSLNGMPYVAHPLSMAVYPPNIVRALIARPATAVEFFYSLYYYILFHFIVAGAGLYVLARREGISMASAVVLSTAVPFSERWVMSGFTQLPMLCAAAWLPVVLLCLREAAYSDRTPRRAAWILLAGIAYGLQILAGWPQLAIYATFLYIAFLALSIGFRQFPRPFSLRGAGRLLRSMVWTGATLGLVGALIGSALMLPAAELIDHSARSSAHYPKFADKGLFVNVDSKTMFDLAQLSKDSNSLAKSGHLLFLFDRTRLEFQSDFLARLQLILQQGDTWFSLNLGLSAVAFSALLLVFRHRVFVYLVLTLLAFDLTFGSPMPLASVLEKSALFALSSPFYCSSIISIPLALLAGFALDRFLAWGRHGPLPRGAIAWLVALAVPLLYFASEPADPASEKSLAWSFMPAALLALLVAGRGLRYWPGLVVGAFLLETALCGAVSIHRNVERPMAFMGRFNSDVAILESPPNDELRRARVMCKPCNHHIWGLESALDGYDPLVLYNDFDVLANPGEEDVYTRGIRVQKNLRASALLKRAFWLAPAFVRGAVPEKDRLFPPTSAVFIDTTADLALPELTLADLPAGPVAQPGEEIEIWRPNSESLDTGRPDTMMISVPGLTFPRRNHALRIYYTSAFDSAVVVRTDGAASPAQRFRTGPTTLPSTAGEEGVFELPLPDFESVDLSVFIQFDPATAPVTVSRLALIEDLADEIDRIHVKNSSANRVVLQLRELLGPRALVFTETNYPGWVATIDGERAPILEAYRAYKAVIVPAGTHEVIFTFRPWRVWAGISISIAAFAVSALLALVLITRPLSVTSETVR